MTPRPRGDRSVRRAELVAAAAEVFGERGVANTSVAQIVKAAGVAQGTFYLYFAAKEDVVLAVAEQLVDDLSRRIESQVLAGGRSAVDQLLALRDVLSSFDGDQTAMEFAVFLHRSENRALHDRVTEPLGRRLAVVVEDVVARGVREGVFRVRDTRAAAWFVLGGLQSVERSRVPIAETPQAIATATELALRALGYEGPIA